MNVAGFDCSPIIDSTCTHNPAPLKEPKNEATAYEIEAIRRLERCSLRTGSFDKRFVGNAASSQVIPSFTPKGRAIIALLLWRYRRQNPLIPADHEYLAAHLQGVERRRWEMKLVQL